MREKNTHIELSERRREILALVINEFIATGKPVGSSRISRLIRERVSPATIRHEMAELEFSGFLHQPHTSAGRVPTRRAYRFYVNSLMEAKSLSQDEIEKIRLCLGQEEDPSVLISRTCELLSEYTNNIGIVVSPPVSEIVMKHIEFVRLQNNRILVILVSQAGVVRQKLIHFEEKLSQTELDQSARYLVSHFQGMNLVQIRRKLAQLISQERAAYDRLMQNAARLGAATLVFPFSPDEDRPDVFFGGAARLFQNLDPSERAKLASLLDALEEKSRLVRIVSECMADAVSGPKVTIGLEDHIEGMRNWSLIVSPYSFDCRSTGSVGILGPSRMEYSRTISLVDSVAKMFGQVLQAG